jgi:fructosamine-3-kinase
VPPQVRPRLHRDPRRAARDGERAAHRRLSPESFIKRGPAADAGRFEAEAEGLAALREAGVRVPKVLAVRSSGEESLIELERLDLSGRADWPALARMLANLHRHAGPRFGWARDNWIGLAPQKNAWRDDWAGFYRDFRLTPQLERAGLMKEASPLLDGLGAFFRAYEPDPSLLHGDLWRGNVGFTREGPVLYDPAVYYGDREADLAMSELFGGFPGLFYEAYRDEMPLDPGYESRKPLYNLYHLLNHLNLFGSGYAGQVRSALGLLLRAL